MRIARFDGAVWTAALVIAGAYLLILAWVLLVGEMPADRLTLIASGGHAATDSIPAELEGLGGQPSGEHVIEAAVPAPLGLVPVLTKLLWGVAAAFVIYQMSQLCRSVGNGDPFARLNAKRLRWSGWAVIGAEAISITATLALDIYVRSRFEAGGWHLSTGSERDPYMIIAGLLLLAVARAFALGRKYQRSAELTI